MWAGRICLARSARSGQRGWGERIAKPGWKLNWWLDWGFEGHRIHPAPLDRLFVVLVLRCTVSSTFASRTQTAGCAFCASAAAAADCHHLSQEACRAASPACLVASIESRLRRPRENRKESPRQWIREALHSRVQRPGAWAMVLRGPSGCSCLQAAIHPHPKVRRNSWFGSSLAGRGIWAARS